jgi:hypothetical protein
LARELETQGVRKQVVADMFGLAMRSYQKRMQKLTESATQRERTLWEAVFELIVTETPTKARVLQRFQYDGEREVSAVLNDLVRSGLAFTTGQGETLVYGATSDEVRRHVQRHQDKESIESWLWYLVFRKEALTTVELKQAVSADELVVDAALTELLASGRLRQNGEILEAANFVLPLGSEQGWETAALDHFRAVAVGIATKARQGIKPATQPNDTIGGSTFTFTLDDTHPFKERVLSLLKEQRATVQDLWGAVASHNADTAPGENSFRVTFYLGQSVDLQALIQEGEDA